MGEMGTYTCEREEERAVGELVDVEERGEEKQQVEVCIGSR